MVHRENAPDLSSSLFHSRRTPHTQHETPLPIRTPKSLPSTLPAEEETRLSEGLGSFPDFDEDSMDSFLPDMSTMPSLTDTLPPAPANNNENALANVINGIHFVASHFRQSSSDSEASEEAATIGADFGRRVTRSRGRPEASQSRPLAVGPPQRPSRHSSQGSDIDIDEYEVVDTRDLPST